MQARSRIPYLSHALSLQSLFIPVQTGKTEVVEELLKDDRVTSALNTSMLLDAKRKGAMDIVGLLTKFFPEGTLERLEEEAEKEREILRAQRQKEKDAAAALAAAREETEENIGFGFEGDDY